MKRIFVVFLVLALCLSATAALADFNHPGTAGANYPYAAAYGSTIFLPQTVTTIETGLYQTRWDWNIPGAPCVITQPCVQPQIQPPPCPVPPTPPTCEPQRDPDYCARMQRHTCLKNAARDVFGYLEGRLRDIGWWHKNYKFVRSFETRVIYGSRGDNNHYKDRRPITFYCKSDSSLKVKAYVNVYKHGKEYITLFSTDFTPAAKCSNKGYTYADDLMITGAYADGYEAVDEFIEYLESLTNGTAHETGCDCAACGK